MVAKMEHLISIGIVVIFIGFIIVFLGILSGKEKDSNAKVAVGGFIGFIPFGFWNDKKLMWLVLVVSACLLILWLIIGFRSKI